MDTDAMFYNFHQTTTNVYASKSHKHPAIGVMSKASRRPNYFLYNIILILSFISGLAFCSFAG